MVTHQLPGRTIRTDGRELLYFSGTSYLGMGCHAAFQELLRQGIARYGTIYSSSRASNVQLAVYEEAERLLASITGAEAALTFSSGFQAGQAAIQQVDPARTFFYAPNTHPAVWRTPSDATYGTFATWTHSIVGHLRAIDGDAVVVANSLDPLMAQPFSFEWVAHLPEDHDIVLLVDDSHGLGITGEDGGGVFATLRALAKSNVTVLVTSSLGKAFGVPGGVVLGPARFVDCLKRSPFFTAGSPVPPAYLSTFTQAQPLYRQARQQLLTNVRYFKERTDDLRIFRSIDDYPVFYTLDNALAPAVASQCVLSCFPYPHPNSELITRVVVSSLHTQADLDTLESLVRKYAPPQNNLL